MIFDKDDDPLYQKQKTVIFWSNMVSVSRLRVKTIAPLLDRTCLHMVQSQVIKAVENKVEFMKEARMGLDIIHILEHLNICS
jgi:hypothetical protein